ncbi:hypothetical protein ACPA9J_15055 [Pseudomonas aeruginosa]
MLPDGTPFNIPRRRSGAGAAECRGKPARWHRLPRLAAEAGRHPRHGKEGEALGGARYVARCRKCATTMPPSEPRPRWPWAARRSAAADRARRPRRIRRGGRRAGPRSARTRP